MDDLVELTHARLISHPLLRDYAEWLKDLQTTRVRCHQDALGTDNLRRVEALKTSEGQWALMAFVTETMGGHQYKGNNVGGRPWTQFRFSPDDPNSPEFDALFYRIDLRNLGFALSLAQYQKEPRSLKSKVARFHTLQDLWLRSWKDESASTIQPIVRKARESKEAELVRFSLDKTPASDIKNSLLQTHKSFVERIAKLGWPVYR